MYVSMYGSQPQRALIQSTEYLESHASWKEYYGCGLLRSEAGFIIIILCNAEWRGRKCRYKRNWKCQWEEGYGISIVVIHIVGVFKAEIAYILQQNKLLCISAYFWKVCVNIVLIFGKAITVKWCDCEITLKWKQRIVMKFMPWINTESILNLVFSPFPTTDMQHVCHTL